MGLLDIVKQIGDSHGINIPFNEVPYISYDGTPSQSIEKSQTWVPINEELKGTGYVPHEADYASFIRTYGAVPWIYTAFWNIATSVSSLSWSIYEVEGDTETELDIQHPLRQLLMNPNPFDSWSDIIELTMIYLETTGNAYWELSEDGTDGIPVGLYVLESEKMYCVSHPEKKIEKYIYDPGTGAKKIPYDPSRIIHFKYANPSSPFYGQGTIKALQNTVITELNREQYTKSFLENEARPDVILKHNADPTRGVRSLTDLDAERIKRKWQEAFQGPRKSRKPVILGDGLDISTLTEAVQDMHYRELEKSLRERVLGSSGVSPALVGLFEFANYANTVEQIKIFWNVAIPPKLRTLSGGIIRGLLRKVKPTYEFRFDTDHIAALEEDPKAKTERLLSLFEHGIYNRNQVLGELGEEDIKEDEFGEAYVMLSSLVPVEDMFNPMPEEPQNTLGPFPGETAPPVKMPELFEPVKRMNATEPYTVTVNVPANPINVETPTVNVIVPAVKRMKKIPIRDNVTGLIKEIKEVEDNE